MMWLHRGVTQTRFEMVCSQVFSGRDDVRTTNEPTNAKLFRRFNSICTCYEATWANFMDFLRKKTQLPEKQMILMNSLHKSLPLCLLTSNSKIYRGFLRAFDFGRDLIQDFFFLFKLFVIKCHCEIQKIERIQKSLVIPQNF